MLKNLTLKFAVIMGAKSAGHDLFAIWLSIMDVSVEEIFKREFPRTRVLTIYQ